VRFNLKYTPQAKSDFADLENDASQKKRFKAVRKALGLMETNIKHPSLNTHKYDSLVGLNGEEVFEAYAENKTSAA